MGLGFGKWRGDKDTAAAARNPNVSGDSCREVTVCGGREIVDWRCGRIIG